MNTSDDMSDSDVLTAVRDRLSGMPLASPPDVGAIMARGRAHRNRRLIPGVTGTVAVGAAATVAAFAVTSLAPASNEASHQGSRRPTVQLAAWTVTKLAGGNISVTVRELKDPAGLQRTLRADGVPASVTFASQQNPACRPYPGGTPRNPLGSGPGTRLLKRVFPKPYKELARLPIPRGPRQLTPVHGGPPPLPTLSLNNTAIVINPSALPGNAGVQFGATPDGGELLLPQVVYASSQCTGS
jgi:hypothetical protein